MSGMRANVRIEPVLLFFSIVSVALVISVSGVLAPQAYAQTSSTETTQTQFVDIPVPEWNLDLTVSPVSINLDTSPGVAKSVEIRVKNDAIGPEYLQIDLAKFVADETGARPRILDLEPGDVFAEWISFSEEQFVVNAGEWKTIVVTFSPPADAALGYYLTLLFNRIQDVTEVGVRQTTITGAPAILMLVNVDTPNAKKEIQLVDFATDAGFYEYLPSKFTVTVENTGNIHVVPSGNIFIDRGNNRDVSIISVNTSGSTILAGSTRTYEVNWDDGMPVWIDKVDNGQTVFDENGNTIRQLSWDLSKVDRLRIGRYTAHLLMVYDNGERDVPIEASVSFWVVPWKLLLVLAIVLIFALVGVRSTVKGMITKAKSASRKG
jgi:hypothetical protein